MQKYYIKQKIKFKIKNSFFLIVYICVHIVLLNGNKIKQKAQKFEEILWIKSNYYKMKIKY